VPHLAATAEDLEQLQGMPEWDEAQKWGWIMQTGRLTGMGASHAGELPKGQSTTNNQTSHGTQDPESPRWMDRGDSEIDGRSEGSLPTLSRSA